MGMIRVVLMEDDEDLLRAYAESIWIAGFSCRAIEDGCYLEEVLGEKRFDIVLSDTDMPRLGGPGAVEKAIERGLLDNSQLVIGMSDNSTNGEYWRGLANLGCFYDKNYFHDDDEIGEIVRQCWRNFQNGWIEKIPKIQTWG